MSLFGGTMVQKLEKTAVPVLIEGLFDRSRSRTVDTLLIVSLSHLRTMLPKSSSRPLPAKRTNDAT